VPRPTKIGRLPILFLIRQAYEKGVPAKAGFSEARGINMGHYEQVCISTKDPCTLTKLNIMLCA
jgi:hypothetical protein